MELKISHNVRWQKIEVASPVLRERVQVIAAKGIPYRLDANRFQSLNLYLYETPESENLVGTVVCSLPVTDADTSLRYLVHIHGGAWRDPLLTADSIEPAVAWAFRPSVNSPKIQAIASINYTLSEIPSQPNVPESSLEHHYSDPSREAVHPQHVRDVLHALSFLRSFGISERSYILSGHSCGACIACQAILQSPEYYGLKEVTDVPCPAAILGLNGLYDLEALVNELGASHEHLRGDYEMLLSAAFGMDKSNWASASPACFDLGVVSKRTQGGKVPRLFLLDQSQEDQLVPLNQLERFAAHLAQSEELSIIKGDRCKGKHAEPWEQGLAIWECVQDALTLLRENPYLSEQKAV